jgi:hypothetical protein
MKTFLFSILILFSLTTRSQYYYNEIQGAQSLGERMKGYTANKVRTITATGYDQQGAKTTDFNEWQEVNAQNNTLRIATRNGQQVTRQTYQFDKDFRLIGIIDSSAGIKSNTTYTYDANNNIILVKTTTNDSLSDFNETREHQWKYNAQGKPEKLWRIINGKDSTEYRFTADEKGNVADEQLYRRGVGLDAVYYYYDDNNRITDIVRYNKKLKKLLPDVMFEYDDNNRVIQKITVISTMPSDYLYWRYAYDEKGLKVREALFNKDQERRGRIDYAYSFLQ